MINKRYFVKTPNLLKPLMGDMVWNIETDQNEIYLTFDDGPTPGVTDWVLDLLKQYNAQATFFCVGKNVVAHPELYWRILEEGHAVGNHSFDHPNGWDTKDEDYFKNVAQCAELVDSNLFRPPYGKISRSQSKKLREQYKLIMWDVLAGDFDLSITAEECYRNVVDNTSKGSIVVLHDSIKAEKNLKYVLPRVFERFQQYRFLAITIN